MTLNTAMMLTRVSVLLLVTGLFAGMWSADSSAGRTAAERQLARRASSPQTVADQTVTRSAHAVVRRANAVIQGPNTLIQGANAVIQGANTVIQGANTAAPNVTRLTSARLTAIPLPQEITPGTYLVVDQTGNTQRVTVIDEDRGSSAPANDASVDQYTVRDGDRRWHFIRVEQPQAPKAMRPMIQSRAVSQR